jgi:hypothetical protein
MTSHAPRRPLRLIGATVALLVLVASACGDDEPVGQPSPTDPAPTTTSPIDVGPSTSAPPATDPGPTTAPTSAPTSAPTTFAPAPTTSAPDTTPPTTAPAGTVALRDFDVDGVRVRVRTPLTELPEQATEIEDSGTLIDEGDGPIMCLGGVQESYPPQCDGPIVDGLVMGDWAETSNGVSFGERTVRVSWPPVDGRITLIGEREYDPPPSPEFPTYDVPEECADLGTPVGVDTLNSYAEAHPDITAIPFLADDTLGVLQVVREHLDEVRDDLTTADAEPCLVPVEYSSEELRVAQEAIVGAYQELSIGWTTGGGIGNRVEVGLAVADRATIRRLAALVENPEVLDVQAITTLLAGE